MAMFKVNIKAIKHVDVQVLSTASSRHLPGSLACTISMDLSNPCIFQVYLIKNIVGVSMSMEDYFWSAQNHRIVPCIFTLPYLPSQFWSKPSPVVFLRVFYYCNTKVLLNWEHKHPMVGLQKSIFYHNTFLLFTSIIQNTKYLMAKFLHALYHYPRCSASIHESPYQFSTYILIKILLILSQSSVQQWTATAKIPEFPPALQFRFL